MFENAKWITNHDYEGWRLPKADELGPCPMFSKNFDIKNPVKKVILSVVGLGQAVYYLNGKRIKDSVRPTHPAKFTHTVIYNQYDITEDITIGKNRFGVILGHIGYSDTGYITWRSNVKLIVQIDIIYADESYDTIVSDTSFKTALSHILFSKRLCGEKIDANLYTEHWNEIDFDDSSWSNAVITKAPGGVLRTTVCPPVREIREIAPIKISAGLYDFKENISGFVRVKVKGNKGEEITLRYAERLNEEKTAVDQSAMVCNAGHPMAHTDKFVLSGKEETFEQLFSYHGFRFVGVEGDYETIELTAVVTHTDLEEKSDFWCDNETINAIHGATLRSIKTNCQGVMLDCPTREQNPWTGDGMMSAETININFDAYGLFYEWMLKFKDEQLSSGGLPCLIPMKDNLWEYNFANGPDWDSAIFFVPYYTYKYTGNREIVDLMWDNMCSSLKYFKSLSEGYLLNCGVGDWAPSGEPCAKQITDTTYYRKDALMMAEMAIATGRDPEPFVELAENIKQAFRKEYIKNGKFSVMHQTALSCAIYGEFLTDEEKQRAVSDLKKLLADNDYRFILGVHGLVMIFDALSENGGIEELFTTVTNSKYDGYAKCIAEGNTTLTEFFSMSYSLNHHFRSPVDTWFYKHLAGIRFGGFGFNDIVIEPKFVNGINKLKANLQGIKVSYDENQISVDSPFDFTLILNGENQKFSAGRFVIKR